MADPIPMGTDVGEGGQISLRWQDDGRAWCVERPLELGSTGERFPCAFIHRLGQYRTRQWELVCSATIPTIVVSVEEEVEVLE